jgi:WD40 repeat protein
MIQSKFPFIYTIISLILIMLSSAVVPITRANADNLDQQIFRKSDGGGYWDDVDWSPDGTMLAVHDGNWNLSVIDSYTGSVLYTCTAPKSKYDGWQDGFRCLKWSPDGSMIASGHADGNIRIWDYRNNTELRNISPAGPFNVIDSIEWSPDSKMIACGDQKDTIYIWNATDGLLIRSITLELKVIEVLDWSPDGRRLAACGGGCGIFFASIFNVQDGSLYMDLACDGSRVSAIIWSHDGKRIATGATDIRIRDATNGSLILSIPFSDSKGPGVVAWAPDDNRLISGGNFGGLNGIIKIWDARTGRLLQTLACNREVTAIRFSPNGTRFAVAGGFGYIQVYSFVSEPVLRSFIAHNGSVESVCWANDGKRLATGGQDGSVKVWDIENGTEIANFQGFKGAVRAVFWSPDGSQIASLGETDGLLVWDAVNFTIQEKLDGRVAFTWSPDGKMIATVSVNNTILLWDIVNGSQVKVLGGYTGPIQALSWSPDGARIASGTYYCHRTWNQSFINTSVEIWNVNSGLQVFSQGGSMSGESNSSIGSALAWSLDMMKFAYSTPNFLHILGTEGWRPLGYTYRKEATLKESISWSPDGSKLAFVQSGTLVLINTSSWNTTTVDKFYDVSPNKLSSVAWAPNGTLLAAGTQNGTVIVWGPYCASEPLHFEPSAPNVPPTIDQVNDIEANSSRLVRVQLIARDNDSTDSSGLRYYLISAPKGMDVREEGLLKWYPTRNQVGNHTITVLVSDGKDASTMSFNIGVIDAGPEYPNFHSTMVTNGPPSLCVPGFVLLWLICASAILLSMRKKSIKRHY